MQVNSYRNTAVVDFEKGKAFLKTWKAAGDLKLMIVGANTGMVQQELQYQID
jgi:hypothetical protein